MSKVIFIKNKTKIDVSIFTYLLCCLYGTNNISFSQQLFKKKYIVILYLFFREIKAMTVRKNLY